MIDKGREFHKVMHDGRNDRRLRSERHKGISIVLFRRVWLARVDTQAGTASGGGPWPLVSCQNKKSCTDDASRPASASRFSSAHPCLKATADLLEELHAQSTIERARVARNPYDCRHPRLGQRTPEPGVQESNTGEQRIRCPSCSGMPDASEYKLYTRHAVAACQHVESRIETW